MYLIETHPTVDNTIMSAYSVLSVPSYGQFLEKILEVKNIFDEVGVLDHIKNQINHYHNKAQKNLEDLSITNKNYLIDFAKLLLKREF